MASASRHVDDEMDARGGASTSRTASSRRTAKRRPNPTIRGRSRLRGRGVKRGKVELVPELLIDEDPYAEYIHDDDAAMDADELRAIDYDDTAATTTIDGNVLYVSVDEGGSDAAMNPEGQGEQDDEQVGEHFHFSFDEPETAGGLPPITAETAGGKKRKADVEGRQARMARATLHEVEQDLNKLLTRERHSDHCKILNVSLQAMHKLRTEMAAASHEIRHAYLVAKFSCTPHQITPGDGIRKPKWAYLWDIRTPLCPSCFAFVHGVHPRTLARLQNQIRSRGFSPAIARKPLRTGRPRTAAEVREGAKAFLDMLASEDATMLAGASPQRIKGKTVRFFPPEYTRKKVFDLYVEHQSTRDAPYVGSTSFARLWKDEYPEIKLLNERKA